MGRVLNIVFAEGANFITLSSFGPLGVFFSTAIIVVDFTNTTNATT